MKNIVIVGKGGFAHEVEWLIERINQKRPTWNFKGFIDKDTSKDEVFGNDEFLLNFENEIYVAIGIGSSDIREKIYNLYKQNSNLKFPNLIDPSVLHSDKVQFGEGNIVCAGTILTVNINIGNCNIFNLNCTVGHDTIIDDFVTVNPNVNISGNVHISRGCNIGTGTQIIQGMYIGEKTVIGAGAVVNKELPGNCVAVGIPVKVIKMEKDTTDAYSFG